MPLHARIQRAIRQLILDGALDAGHALPASRALAQSLGVSRDTVEAAPYFDNPHAGKRPDPNDPQPERGGFAPRWEGRVMTRFEERGIEAGRTIHDIEVVRNGRSS